MRKFGEYVRAAYGCFSAKWIFGVLAALSLLPTLTKTVLLCITKESLTAGAVFLQTCSALSAPVFRLFGSPLDERKRKTSRRYMAQGLSSLYSGFVCG